MKRIRIVLATLAFLAATSAQASSAFAGHQWCEEDPEFLVNGALVDVTTMFPGSYAGKVGSVHFDLQVPSNALAVVLSLPGLAGTLLNTVDGTSTSPMKAKFKMYGVGLLGVL
jgi:hypothetical protein